MEMSSRARFILYCITDSKGFYDTPKWMPDPQAVAKLSSVQLLMQPNFGKKSLAEVIKWLKSKKLKLADDPRPIKQKRCAHCGQVIRRNKKTGPYEPAKSGGSY